LYNEYYFDDRNLENKEKYVAPMYNYMISKGHDIFINHIDISKIHVLGTPEELDAFLLKPIN
jgi:hypothetical protein